MVCMWIRNASRLNAECLRPLAIRANKALVWAKGDGLLVSCTCSLLGLSVITWTRFII